MSVRRVMGTEVEYGIAVPGQPSANPMVASSQVVNAYASATVRARRARWDFEEESPLRDARGFDMSRQVADSSQLTDEDLGLANVILTNGARLYVDHAHPEYSTPEVTTPLDVVRWEKAGEQVMLDASRRAGQLPGGAPIVLYKNNTDGKGASYGTHENYLMRRSTPFSEIVRHLTPFFVSRQVVCGAGRVGIGPEGREHGYQLSQRADFFEVEVGLETTLKRPIINTRDEPHADPDKYRRLHVIIGDANLSEVSTFLKVGTTSLVLAMIEDRSSTATSPSTAGLRAAGGVPRPHPDDRITMTDGHTLTGVQLQLEYLDLARRSSRTARRRRRRPDRRHPAPLGVGARPARAGPDDLRPRARLGRQLSCSSSPLPPRPASDDTSSSSSTTSTSTSVPRRGSTTVSPRPGASSGCSTTHRSTTRCTTAEDTRASSGPLPGEVRRRGRGCVLGLGDLDLPGRSRFSGCPRSTRCGQPCPRRRPARPLRPHGRPGRRARAEPASGAAVARPALTVGG